MKKTIIALTQFVLIANASAQVEKLISNSWALKNTGTIQAFDLSFLQSYRLQARAGQDIHLAAPMKGKKIRVAVIDTGVDVNHPLLKDRIYRNAAECGQFAKYEKCVEEQGIAGCGDILVDADKNGYAGDCHGWSTLGEANKDNVIGMPNFSDDAGHGTHVAGIVASVSENIEILPIQVIGKSPNQPIKPFSVDLSPNENIRGGFSSDPLLADRFARGIIYAIHAKADVINLSIGWPQGTDAEIMREAVAEAQRRGIIVVAAAGNDSTTMLLRPCQYKGVICVGAQRPDGSMAHFSNYGFGVDIAAPGVTILSTVPSDNRSISLPGYSGIDILSGTSQASPFVAGVVAEMLSRGIKPQEVYARLVLGARPVQKELPVLVGPVQTAGVPTVSQEPYTRYVLSGLMDMQNSLNVKAQPLILNADKEVQVIKWNRQSSNLKFEFPIKNYWSSVVGKKIEVRMVPKDKVVGTPTVESAVLKSSAMGIASQEEKIVAVNLKISDTTDPSRSKMPSDLSFDVQILIDGQLHRTFEMRAEVIVVIDKNYQSSEVTQIPVIGQLDQGMKKLIIDEIYDSRPNDRDYFGIVQLEDSFAISLMKYENGKYIIAPSTKVPFEGKIYATKPYNRIRMDIDGDGRSEYILGLREFKVVDGFIDTSDYTMHLYIFDEQMQLKKHVAFYDARALMAVDVSWIKIGKELRPAWVGTGKKVIKQHNVMDLWQVDENEKPSLGVSDINFYYLDENYKLASIDNRDGFKIVDILQPRAENVKQGILPVLLAKNLGNEAKPSYLNDFSMGWVSDGKLMPTITTLNKVNSQMNYRNLVDTIAKDKMVNLAKTSDEYAGAFWFGFDAHRKQRVTLLDYSTNSLVDRILPSDRSLFDSALWVRAAFSSQNQKGVFLMTNTEIEYHDLNLNTTARSSLNKYSFFGDEIITDLQFPISLVSQDGKTKAPALFTTEGSELNKGVKFLVPTQNGDSKNYKMISPARLRLSAPVGCRPIDAPVYINGGYSMDYDCGTQLMRFKLAY